MATARRSGMLVGMKANKYLETGGPTAAPLPGRTDPSHRILLVEDDTATRLMSTALLVRSGYHVEAVEDGAAGWEALQARRYHLLITDNSMPKVTGVELIKLLRAQDPTLPVIMASGANPTEELERHPWLDISAFLLKPYTSTEFLGTVKEVLRGTGGAREPMAPRPSGPDRPSADGLQWDDSKPQARRPIGAPPTRTLPPELNPRKPSMG